MKVQKWCLKHLDAGGIAITSSENVSDEVLYVAKDIVLKITSKRPEIRGPLSIYECILVARGESVAAALELDGNDSRYEFGCTLPLPHYPKVITQLASVVEWEGNPNMGVFVHELAHAISNVIPALDSNFHSLLYQAYEKSKGLGRFANPMSAINQSEYWAEGVRIWYHDIRPGWKFETREAFKLFDPDLTNLLDDWLSEEEIPQGY